jgi:hypothetical protein
MHVSLPVRWLAGSNQQQKASAVTSNQQQKSSDRTTSDQRPAALIPVQ